MMKISYDENIIKMNQNIQHGLKVDKLSKYISLFQETGFVQNQSHFTVCEAVVFKNSLPKYSAFYTVTDDLHMQGLTLQAVIDMDKILDVDLVRFFLYNVFFDYLLQIVVTYPDSNIFSTSDFVNTKQLLQSFYNLCKDFTPMLNTLNQTESLLRLICYDTIAIISDCEGTVKLYYDCEFGKTTTERLTNIFKKELVQRTWHPSRIIKWCLDMEDLKDIFGK